ncbi:hypothetical protein QLX08_004335 [Tetragonisca angustula]|uniref:Uncharacterized protein n=1 Tax=Tetragonisca angustula TaxID=166442 RepID=A0AAW1A330_9HYME
MSFFYETIPYFSSSFGGSGRRLGRDIANLVRVYKLDNVGLVTRVNGPGRASEVVPKGGPEPREWWSRCKKNVCVGCPVRLKSVDCMFANVFLLAYVVFCVYHSVLNFIYEDISLQFEERITNSLIPSSHFVFVFYYILEEWISGSACVLSRNCSS